MTQHGLRLHPEKTRIVEARTDDKGFDFLGYRFAKGRRYVRPKSLQALREKIRQKTGRTRSGSLRHITADLNPMLRGWFGYFKHARSSTFQAIDGFVRRRLRAILRRRHKRAGSGRTLKVCFRRARLTSLLESVTPALQGIIRRFHLDAGGVRRVSTPQTAQTPPRSQAQPRRGLGAA